jgi:serine/threonine-protein phosphatase 6 regulatory ankyrin repeat subunit B
MSKTQNVLKKIAANSDTISELQETQSFKDFYNFCKKIEPDITELEIEEIKQELIGRDNKNNISLLSDEKANIISGGKMDFNRFKALAVATLVTTSMIPSTSYAMQTSPSYSTDSVQTTKVQIEKKDQEMVDEAFAKAVGSGDKTKVKELLDKGVNPNTKVNNIFAALIDASDRGFIDIVELLLERGADIEISNKRFGTALTVAAMRGNTNIIGLLLDSGANINATNADGLTALMFAAMRRDTNVISLLLDSGANINVKANNGKMAIHYAAENGHEDAMKLLLDRGISIDEITLKQLTEQSEKVNTEKMLDEALLQAVIVGDKTLVGELLDQGAHIDKSHCVKVDAKFISDELYSTNPKEKSVYRNALGLATLTGQIELAEFLLEKGADINMNAGSGTALRFAAENGHIDVVRLLLDNGAKDVQEQALSSAINNSQVNVVKLLLERGANANKKEFWTKFSLLMKAARVGNAEIVKLLLEYGASVFVKDNEGKIALDYAKTDEIRAILKESAEKAWFFEKLISNIKYWTGLDRFF